MKRLTVEQLCSGIFKVIENARGLLDESKTLMEQERIARAYGLAYMACEEMGKVPILVRAATRVALDREVDWKTLAKRFRSHESKAMQFNGLDLAAPVIVEAALAGKKSVDRTGCYLPRFRGCCNRKQP